VAKCAVRATDTSRFLIYVPSVLPISFVFLHGSGYLMVLYHKTLKDGTPKKWREGEGTWEGSGGSMSY
jgi:hypothetical protein